MRQSLATATVVVGLLVAAPVWAQRQPGVGANPFAGEWVVTVANYRETFPLTVKVAESAVSGSYRGAPIIGELKNGQIVFATPKTWAEYRAGKLGVENATNEYSTVYFAKLNEAGDLAGTADVYIPGTAVMQKMTWSARRAAGS